MTTTFRATFVQQSLAAIRAGSAEDVQFSNVVIDGRKAKKDSLFFALTGANHDGHDFVAQAMAAGARGVVIERSRIDALKLSADVAVFGVDDTTRALAELAQAYRGLFPDLQVVAVTGSNGKTTTKEMIAAILRAHAGSDRVHQTVGNLNNHLGLPLSMLALESQHQYAVFELGMSALGEIEQLASWCRPVVAAVTNVAPVHLETLGSMENIGQAKAEIWKSLPPTGTAIAPVDDGYLSPYFSRLQVRKRTFGVADDRPDIGYRNARVTEAGTSATIVRGEREMEVVTPLLGLHQASNMACAIAIADELQVSDAAIVSGLGNVKPARHRGERTTIHDRIILDDCYNAAPASMKAALDLLSAIGQGRKKVAILGDMLELGPTTHDWHAEIGRYTEGRADLLVGVGLMAKVMVDAANQLHPNRAFWAASFEEAAEYVYRATHAGDLLLLKASRGVGLERWMDVFEKFRPEGMR